MFSIDRRIVAVRCPRCDFSNGVTIRQIRTRDIVICRGCKANVRLEDHMNQVRKAERLVRRQVEALRQSLQGLKLTIRL